MNPDSRRKSTSNLLRDLAARGRYDFSAEEVGSELGVSLAAARSALRRLRKKGLVASPQRGFDLIVPPEYQHLGCLPAEQFVPQLMTRHEIPYYAGLMTAARYHGAAHQQPQVFQVVVPRNRPPIRCGRVRVDFVARRNAAAMPTVSFNTPRGYLRVSSPEGTAFDLVGYPQHGGGLDHVATMLAELGEKLDSDRLAALGALSPLPWAQRLGFLLERVGHSSCTRGLAAFVAEHASETVALVPGAEASDASRDARWRLLVNATLEPDL